MKTYIRRRRSVTLLYTHLVFTTKYRRRVISGRVLATLSEAAHSAASELGVTIEEINGEADHRHLLVRYPPDLPLSRLVQRLKSRSSGAVRAERFPEVQSRLWGDHFWSPSYFAVSCGGAPLDVIKAYIEGQGGSHPA
jgi:putative transposase